MMIGVVSLTGLKRIDTWEEQDRELRTKYVDAIQSFPDKMDEFFEAMDKARQ
jgi:hypothetical protein